MGNNLQQSPRKSNSIPGYGGYRPNIKANVHIGKTVTEQSREVFKPSVLDAQANNFATTGFNASLIPKEDETREATSRRYGTKTNFLNHPCIAAGD